MDSVRNKSCLQLQLITFFLLSAYTKPIDMNKKSKPKKTNSQIAQNKRARHDYLIQETFEAGIQLEGWEGQKLA